MSSDAYNSTLGLLATHIALDPQEGPERVRAYRKALLTGDSLDSQRLSDEPKTGSPDAREVFHKILELLSSVNGGASRQIYDQANKWIRSPLAGQASEADEANPSVEAAAILLGALRNVVQHKVIREEELSPDERWMLQKLSN